MNSVGAKTLPFWEKGIYWFPFAEKGNLVIERIYIFFLVNKIADIVLTINKKWYTWNEILTDLENTVIINMNQGGLQWRLQAGLTATGIG